MKSKVKALADPPSGESLPPGLLTVTFLCSHMANRVSSGFILFLKGCSSYRGVSTVMTSSKPTWLSKLHFLILSRWGLGFHPVNLGEAQTWSSLRPLTQAIYGEKMIHDGPFTTFACVREKRSWQTRSASRFLLVWSENKGLYFLWPPSHLRMVHGHEFVFEYVFLLQGHMKCSQAVQTSSRFRMRTVFLKVI